MMGARTQKVREMVEREAASDSGVSAAFDALADRRVFQLDDDKTPDLLLLEENLLRVIMRVSRCYGLRPPLGERLHRQ
jgi:hypothetical protein